VVAAATPAATDIATKSRRPTFLPVILFAMFRSSVGESVSQIHFAAIKS
jgi:hypothetical protein